MQNVIEIYTDGSTVENGKLFNGNGWAYVIPEKNIQKSGKAYGDNITTARMELCAVVEALEYIVNHKGNYVIYCDSEGTVNCFKGYGARKLYKDLWNKAHALVQLVLVSGSKVSMEFLDRTKLEQSSNTFKYAQQVDKLAYIQANSLEIK